MTLIPSTAMTMMQMSLVTEMICFVQKEPIEVLWSNTVDTALKVYSS
jgi:hypothetical protein